MAHFGGMARIDLSGVSGGLSWTATNYNAGLLDRFYIKYDKIFTIEDEKETMAGFSTLLELQHDKRAMALSKYGAYEEWFVVFQHQGVDIGGMNFSIIQVRGDMGTGPAVGIHSSYAFLDPSHRGKGYSKVMFRVVREIAARYQGRQFVLFEMNDALRMPGPQLKRDMNSSGLHPVDRWAVSASWGAKVLCFPYIQPALSGTGKPEDGLVLFCMEGEPLSAIHLHQHLETFFNLSVLKGADCRLIPEAEEQLAFCRQLPGPVPAACLKPHLQELRQIVDQRMSSGTADKGPGLCRWLEKRLEEQPSPAH